MKGQYAGIAHGGAREMTLYVCWGGFIEEDAGDLRWRWDTCD